MRKDYYLSSVVQGTHSDGIELLNRLKSNLPKRHLIEDPAIKYALNRLVSINNMFKDCVYRQVTDTERVYINYQVFNEYYIILNKLLTVLDKPEPSLESFNVIKTIVKENLYGHKPYTEYYNNLKQAIDYDVIEYSFELDTFLTTMLLGRLEPIIGIDSLTFNNITSLLKFIYKEYLQVNSISEGLSYAMKSNFLRSLATITQILCYDLLINNLPINESV